VIPLVVCDNEEKRILSILAFDESQKIFREEIFSASRDFFLFFFLVVVVGLSLSLVFSAPP